MARNHNLTDDEILRQAAAIRGRRGGPARMKNLSPKQRKDLARKAAKARWAKKK
jgi:hypothetical protein